MFLILILSLKSLELFSQFWVKYVFVSRIIKFYFLLLIFFFIFGLFIYFYIDKMFYQSLLILIT